MPARSHDILCDFLGRCQTSATKAASSQRSAGSVAKATSALLATARAVLAASPVTKDAAPAPRAAAAPAPKSGPRYVARAPRTPRATPGTAAAVFQGAVRNVPEPDGSSSAAAAFDQARAAREDGRYGVPITGAIS